MNKEKILMDLIMDHHHSGKLVWKKTTFSDMFETEINNLGIKIFIYDTGSNIRFQTRTHLSNIILREREYPEIGLIVKSLPIPPRTDDIDDIIDSLDGKRGIRDKKIKSILEQEPKEQEPKSIPKEQKKTLGQKIRDLLNLN